ncbi:YkvA family protein [Rhodoferax sp. WC2427]|uniref:YkvA family protein n=1 Tax=Rhodoferax sp. WC2427 TaxID=3234144 RepID=UPI003467C606
MWKRVSLVWSAARGDARLLWLALQHPQSPPWLKWGAAGIVLYLLSPMDLIPDFIPVAGLLDDLVLVPLAMAWLLKKLPAHIVDDITRRARGGDTAATKVVRKPR